MVVGSLTREKNEKTAEGSTCRITFVLRKPPGSKNSKSIFLCYLNARSALSTTVAFPFLVVKPLYFPYAFRADSPRKNARTGGVGGGVVYLHRRPEWKVQL